MLLKSIFKKTISIYNLIFYLRKLKKEGETKAKARRKKEIIIKT